MPFRIPKGYVRRFRYRKIKSDKQRIGGYAKPHGKKFVKIVEVKTIKNKVTKRRI